MVIFVPGAWRLRRAYRSDMQCVRGAFSWDHEDAAGISPSSPITPPLATHWRIPPGEIRGALTGDDNVAGSGHMLKGLPLRGLPEGSQGSDLTRRYSIAEVLWVEAVQPSLGRFALRIHEKADLATRGLR